MTQDTIGNNLRNLNWSTKQVRPPTSYTNPLKVQQMQECGDTVSDPSAAGMQSFQQPGVLQEGSPDFVREWRSSSGSRNLRPEPFKTRINGQTMGARQKGYG